MRYVVIMAGGSGKRLWPLSRQGMPKQLLHLVGGKSLLRITYERVRGTVPDDHILVCSGAAYSDVVTSELPELPAGNLLGEPVGRDSLNAVAWPAAVLAARDPEAVVAMVTADALMSPDEAFREALTHAFEVAEDDAEALVTFGVVPTSAHTGYGYLRRGDALPGHEDACQVVEFKEKPDAVTAQAYLASGEYWWNSGMFVWRAETLLRQLAALLPTTHAAVVELAAHPDKLAEIYPTLHKTSVDYAVMEPVGRGEASAHVVAVRLPITWYDVGGFATLAELLPRDDDGNAVEGDVVQLDGAGNLVINRGGDHVVGLVGVRDMIVVVTPDATLVCPMGDAERIKGLVELIAKEAPEHA